jgi:hypothetical protein
VIKKTLIAAAWLMVLVGCAKNEEPANPVSWYQQHEADMQAKVAWCRDDAQRQRTPDCQNAAEAKRRLALGSQKNLAPIDWTGADKLKP